MRASVALLPPPSPHLLQLALALLAVACEGGLGGRLAATASAPRELPALLAANNKTTQLAAGSKRAANYGPQGRGDWQRAPAADKELPPGKGHNWATYGEWQVVTESSDWPFKRPAQPPGAASTGADEDRIAARATSKGAINATTRPETSESRKHKQRARLDSPTRLAMTSARQPGSATYDRAEQQQQQQQQDYLTRLYLDTNVPLEVQTHIGNIAYLMCRLRAFQQHEQQLRVSWVRNMQILTSGEFRYTSDERFRPTHVPGTQDWVLEVHNVNANDEGVYECQVNSEPKPASVSLYLHVMTATMEILESPQAQVGEGERIRLTCRVEFSSQAQLLQTDSNNSTNADETATAAAAEPATSTTPAPVTKLAGALSSQHYIYWYKDNVSLEYNNQRGGIRVERRDNASSLESVLTVEGAGSADSGTYLCRIVPELNEVPVAQTQVLVGGASSSSSSSRSRRQAGHADRLASSVGLQAFVALLIALLAERLTRCGPAAIC